MVETGSPELSISAFISGAGLRPGSKMFGIGSTELLLILVVALIVLGPKSLAQVSRSLGKAIGDFRRVSTDFQRAINLEMAEDEMRQKEKERKAAEQPKSDTQNAAPEATPDQSGTEERENAPLAQALAKSRAMARESQGKSQDMESKP